MKTTLQLRTATSLTLTPQLQQTIRLLQLSTLEMQQELEQMLADNPFLERMEDESAQGQDLSAGAGNDTDGDAYADSSPDAEWDGEDTLYDIGNVPDAYSALQDDDAMVLQDLDWNAGSHTDQGSTASSSDDADWGDYSEANTDDGDWDNLHTTSVTGHDDPPTTGERNSQAETLQEHLHRQALGLRLGDQDRAALYMLIESLNDDGLLEDSLGELAESLIAAQADSLPLEQLLELQSDLLHHLTVALRLLHTLEPVGVGARNLAECLQLQLKALPIDDTDTQRLLAREVALDVCRQPLEYLARRDVRNLARLMPYKPEHIKGALQLISTLEPRPARAFALAERNIIVPDVLVRPNTGADAAQRPWMVHINPAVLPRVQVHEVYAKALRQHKGEGSQALQQRLQEARWMVKSVQQRFDTILRVSTAIVEHQRRFFEQGVLALEPLVLRTIADELQLHESTVSRVTTAKYMATPWGTFELKYFFASGIHTSDEGSTSSTAVRAMIAQLVASEPPAKPYSDGQLHELLLQQGVQCARRTVAKYRESLRIPPVHLRRTLD